MKLTQSVLALSILYLPTFHAISANVTLLTEQERKHLSSIRSQHDYQEKLAALNKKLSVHSSSVWDYANTADAVRELELYLKEKVLALDLSQNNSDTLNDFKKVINQKNQLVQKLDSLSNLDIKYQKLKQEFTLLETENKKLKANKRALLTSVVKRIQSDIAQQTISATRKGTQQCLKSQSISSCLDSSEPLIKKQIINEQLFLNNKSTFYDYQVLKANMDMHGTLNYEVSYRAQPMFSKNIYFELNKTFGFDSIPVTLKSNAEASWYINGQLMGKGKSLEVELADGANGILATYQGFTESSVENIIKPTSLTYNFTKPTQGKHNDVSLAKPTYTDTSNKSPSSKSIVSQSGGTFTLMVNKSGDPLLSDWSESIALCRQKPLSQLAVLNDFVKLVEEDKYQYLFKYNFNTADYQTVAFAHDASITKQASKGLTLCKPRNTTKRKPGEQQ